jgi:pSer/pThr/pTyr-binding forkhead associated (FHA) protein
VRPAVGQVVLAINGTVLGEALLVPGRFVIGRTPDNDMQIDNRFVSRHHAQIVTTEDGSWIEDLNSTNGIFVRGKRVRRCKLQVGDVATIGTHELRYSRATPEPSTGSLPAAAVANAAEKTTPAQRTAKVRLKQPSA